MSIDIHKIEELYEFKKNTPEEIIKNGILEVSTLLLISGQPKARKSFLTYNLALGIATGRSFAGFQIPNAQKVILISAEGGKYSNSNRITKMIDSMNLTEQELSTLNENFCISFIPKLWLNDESARQSLEDIIRQHQPGVLVLDPFIRFHTLNENSANEMGNIFGILGEIMSKYNTSIILVHHHGKNDHNGARGSSAIRGDYTSGIKISTTDDKVHHKLEFELRNSEPKDSIILYFNSETFWFQNILDIKQDAMMEVLREHGLLKKSEWVRIALKEKIAGKSTVYKRIDSLEEAQLVKLVDDFYSPN